MMSEHPTEPGALPASSRMSDKARRARSDVVVTRLAEGASFAQVGQEIGRTPAQVRQVFEAAVRAANKLAATAERPIYIGAPAPIREFVSTGRMLTIAPSMLRAALRAKETQPKLQSMVSNVRGW